MVVCLLSGVELCQMVGKWVGERGGKKNGETTFKINKIVNYTGGQWLSEATTESQLEDWVRLSLKSRTSIADSTLKHI